MASYPTKDGGFINEQRWTYTRYDPATGQLVSQPIALKYRNSAGLSAITSGQFPADAFERTEGNYLGGRANVNVRGQVMQVFEQLSQQYPQIPRQSLEQYANKWVSERIAAGWDANEVENMMKDVTRNPNSMNNDFLEGVRGMIRFDENSAGNPNDTGNNTGTGPDPRGSIQDELRAFSGRMMSVLPPDSPQVKRIAELAQQAGNKYATQSGMGPGGITSTNVAKTAARANVDLQTQREGIGAQALAAAGNQQLSVDQLNTQLQQQNQQANTLNGSNIGGMIGTGAGMIGGIVASAYGAPQALPGLMQAGGSAGQAVGGIAANSAQGPISYGGGAGKPASTYKGRSWGTS